MKSKSCSRGQANSFVATVLVGFTDERIAGIDGKCIQEAIDKPDVFLERLVFFLNNSCKTHVVGNHIINCNQNPFVPEGWKVEEHKRTGEFTWDPNKIILHFEDEQKDGSVNGHELRKRLEKKSVMNACVLDYLLAYPELIPSE